MGRIGNLAISRLCISEVSPFVLKNVPSQFISEQVHFIMSLPAYHLRSSDSFSNYKLE